MLVPRSTAQHLVLPSELRARVELDYRVSQGEQPVTWVPDLWRRS